jgi:hypothetical protein
VILSGWSMMSGKIKNKIIYIICIASFFAAFSYNEINLKHLPENLVREGQTVITSDDASYYHPPLEYLKGKGWQEDYWGGKIGYFIRPPGYGILYLIFLKIGSFSFALILIKFLQLLLFSCSVYWFYSIALIGLKNNRFAIAGAAVYGLSPFFIGFLYYTLTEGITPSLLLCFVYLLFKAYNSKNRKHLFYFLASSVFAYLFIVRPVLGIFGLLLPVFIISDFYEEKLKIILFKLIVFGTVAMSLMLVWQIRNYKIAGKYVGLHPIYFEDGNTIFREPFKKYWEFAGGWAERGDAGFSYMIPLWNAAINGDTSLSYVNNAIDKFPAHVRNYFGSQKLTEVLRDYQSSVLYQKTFYDKQLPMPEYFSPSEIKVIHDFENMIAEYKSQFWFRYYFLSPVKVFKLMTFHSNLSLYIFQRTYRGTFLMEATRLFFYSIHGLCFLVLLLNLFIVRENQLLKWVIALVPFIYVFYLCFFQRGIEERYTLPVLSFLMIGLMYSLQNIYFFFKDQKIAG